MWLSYIEYKNPIVFCKDQRLFDVNRGQNVKILKTLYFKDRNMNKGYMAMAVNSCNVEYIDN